ncbi:MAG: hypothetical protein RL095_2107 [Verrucomicrobiota bacterium]
MKKKILIVLGVLLALLVLGLICGVLFFGSIVKTGVSEVGPKITQSPCDISGASLNPLTGSCSIEGFSVGNPKGDYKQPHAFKFDKFSVKLQPSSLLSDKIIIDEVLISGTQIDWEGFTGENLTTLQKNIEDFVNKLGGDKKPEEGKKPEAEEPKAEEKPGKKVIIKLVRVENSSIMIGSLNTAIPMPPLTLKDIGGSDEKAEGVSTAEAVKEIFNSILASVSNVVKDALNKAGKLIGDGASKVGEMGKDAGKAIGEGAGKAVEGLKKLNPFGN